MILEVRDIICPDYPGAVGSSAFLKFELNKDWKCRNLSKCFVKMLQIPVRKVQSLEQILENVCVSHAPTGICLSDKFWTFYNFILNIALDLKSCNVNQTISRDGSIYPPRLMLDIRRDGSSYQPRLMSAIRRDGSSYQPRLMPAILHDGSTYQPRWMCIIRSWCYWKESLKLMTKDHPSGLINSHQPKC